MCGICGSFGRGDRQVVETMLATLVHRGPDDGHAVAGTDFALGVRRLAIVDVAGGRQPLTNEDGSVWAAQNGELYNFPEIRPRLVAAGHRLTTQCDTEILPHLYEDHGAGFAEHIDGMFAVAVWDDRAKVGILARDRMGKKPLYYWRTGEVLYFASEIKALLAIPGFERRLDLEALHHYLSYKHVPHPLSIFTGVRALPPAHVLVYRPGQEPMLRRYWDVDFSGQDATAWHPEEIADRLLALLRRGVKRRLMADVPIGFFLSGGIDSSLSTVLAAEQSPARIKTFTLTYDADSTTEGKEQDRRWARWVAERWGTEHYEERITFADFPGNLRRILRSFDEPFAGTMSTYFLAQAIARHVKVALSGDGADELFGSYLSHRLAQPLARWDHYRRTGEATLIQPVATRPEIPAGLAGRLDWDWRHELSVFTDEDKANLYAPDVAAALEGRSSREHLRSVFEGLTARDPLNRILEAEFRTIFPDQVLTFVDRLSMAHSLEVRTAFLDTDVVTFVASLPGALKIHDGETKALLKRVARRRFPDEMVYRPKEGFVMPITDWLTGELVGYVRDTLAPDRLAKHGLFDAVRVRTLVEGLFAGPRPDYRYVNRVLSLIVFQEWYELYMM